MTQAKEIFNLYPVKDAYAIAKIRCVCSEVLGVYVNTHFHDGSKLTFSVNQEDSAYAMEYAGPQ